MADNRIAFKGLTLLEALERFTSPAIYQEWQEAETRRAKVRGLATGVDRYGQPYFDRKDPAVHAADLSAARAFKALWADFRGQLEEGNLAGVGRRGSPMAAQARFPESAWGYLVRMDLDACTVRECAGEKAVIYDVTIGRAADVEAWEVERRAAVSVADQAAGSTSEKKKRGQPGPQNPWKKPIEKAIKKLEGKSLPKVKTLRKGYEKILDLMIKDGVEGASKRLDPEGDEWIWAPSEPTLRDYARPRVIEWKQETKRLKK